MESTTVRLMVSALSVKAVCDGRLTLRVMVVVAEKLLVKEY